METKISFEKNLGKYPLCADDYRHGSYRIPREVAKTRRHIEPNAPHVLRWMVFDIDRRGGGLAPEFSGLPPPSIVCVNPVNGHAHVFYGLQVPVYRTAKAHEAPLRFFCSVQEAFRIKLDADPSFNGPLAKNPLNPYWKTQWGRRLYDLPDLAEYVDLPRLRRRSLENGLAAALGRNSSLFEALRVWAYQHVRAYQTSHASFEHWGQAVLRTAEMMNTFATPLPRSEVRAVSKSVSRWVWRRFSPEHFSRIQTARALRGGRPPTTCADGKPWDAMAISRATYYRRLKSGLIIAA